MNTPDPATRPLASRRGVPGGRSSALALLTPPTGLPRVLDVELPRLRLVRLLEGRWDRSVTLLVAGPGFGKTTVLAQAVRAHQVAPRGIDVWVGCEAAYEDPACFARALLGAILLYSDAGFTLAEQKALMASRTSAPDEWSQLARRKVAELDEQIARAQAAREAISHGLRCPHEDIIQCPNFNAGITARLAGQPLSRSHQQLHGQRSREAADT